MKLFFIILNLLLVSALLSQSTDFFIPAGFNNPFLKSGQIITSVYWNQNLTATSVQDDRDSETLNKNFSFVGLLGLTDRITLRADVDVFPAQKVYEITSGGSGKDKETFNIAPSVTLSYRPISNLEIFGNLVYQAATREYGERQIYQDIPVSVDNDGKIIYAKGLVAQPGWEYSYQHTAFKVGVSYLGKLW